MKQLHLLLLLPLLLFGGCLPENAEGRKVIQFMPKQNLYRQAADAYQETLKDEKLVKSGKDRRIVQRVAQRIIQQAEALYPEYCKGFKWEIELIDDDKTVNAFVMPGGKMAVYTGILKVAENEAALAVVVGHEVAHALLNHGNERMSQATLVSAGLAVSNVALSETDKVAEKNKKRILIALGLGSQYGVLLPYSRVHENEADRVGLRLSAAAGYEPREAYRLWERMHKKGGGAPFEFLSTHPSHHTRIDNLKAQVSDVQGLYDRSAKHGLGEKF